MPPARRPPADRRRRLLLRALPAFALAAALVALLVWVVAGKLGPTAPESAASRFAAAWERGDYAAMHAALAPAARERVSPRALARAHDAARATSTARAVDAGEPEQRDEEVALPVAVRTAVFGTLRGEVRLPVDGDGVGWAPEAVFPGLRRGERLARRSVAPPRARILTRDGEAIAAGPAGARTAPLGPAGEQIAGRVEPAAGAAERRALHARGFPQDAPVGVTGLERILESRLAGTPGGALLAGGRELARADPRPAPDVRTTIDADVQRAATEALGGRFGGVAALDARTAEVRALAGIAFSAPQPPGSTFKIVTAVAALERGLVKPGTRFPVQTATTIDGAEIENANGESCGGTFVETFAHSCNSVFAPLGVRLGARALVEAAERFGFNEAPPLAGAAPSTLPPAREMTSQVEVGASAIGQGRVLATPLLMAGVAQAIAADGVRRRPSVLPGGGGRGVRVTSARVARQLERMMIAVVADGTGTKASLAPVRVAGKTGTAELEDTSDDAERPVESLDDPPGSDTDAWFTAYAPARRPRLAVAVLLVRNGAGGDTAAPVAREVLRAGLR